MTIDDILGAGAPPVVAILRGITPEEIVPAGKALVAAGIRLIEVPLNSPSPFESIGRLVDAVGDQALCGAGTVLSTQDVDGLVATKGDLMVTPNTDPEVIAAAVAKGLNVMPGFATISEAFSAYRAGARRIKLFPAATYGIGYLGAIKEVLPKDVRVWAVGGTGAANLSTWLDAGAEGIGVGGALYRAGDDLASIARKAEELAAAWEAHRSGK